jgi:hypothetical protein
MKILKDVTEGIEPFPVLPYQQALLDKLSQGGFKHGQLTLFSAGRQTGKSTLSMQSIKDMLDALHNRPIEDLVLSEGKVYGARYYCVGPIGGNWADMEQWCKESFGAHGGAIWGMDPNKPPFPNERWYMNNSKFWFRTEKDRNWFIMKWSK